METVAQILVTGIVVGSVYAFIGLGMSLVFSISRIINLAQGGFVVLAALSAVKLSGVWGLPLGAAAAITVAGMALVLWLVERLVMRPGSRRATPDRLLLITVGVLQVIGGALLVFWGNLPFTMRPFSAAVPFTIAGVKVAAQDVWVASLLAACLVLLWALLNRTSTGLTLRAAASNPDAARLQGVDVDRMRSLAFLIAGVLAGVAGVAIVPLTYMSYSTTIPYAINGFIAAVLGGLGRSSGAVLGGLLLGLLQATFGRYTSGPSAEVAAIAVLVILLMFRPSGLVGRPAEARR